MEHEFSVADIKVEAEEFIKTKAASPIFGTKSCIGKIKNLIEDWKNIAWICSYCNNEFDEYQTFKCHQLKFHAHEDAANVYYQCRECGELQFGYATFLNHTRKSHFDALKYCCDVCNEFFPSYVELAAHRDGHNETENNHPAIYHCTMCEEAASSEKDIKNHIRLEHNLNSDEFSNNDNSNTTEERTKNLPSLETVKANCILTESIKCEDEYNETEQTFNCGKCVKTFQNESDLKAHLDSGHDDDCPYACSMCTKRFRNKNYLKNHVARHNEHRPFKCAVCEKTFKTMQDKQVFKKDCCRKRN